jgi:hypothetical protein
MYVGTDLGGSCDCAEVCGIDFSLEVLFFSVAH